MNDSTIMATSEKADLSWITIVPGQRFGQPCIRGLRITVSDVLDMLASGMTEDEILADFPYLEKLHFPAVYAFAAISAATTRCSSPLRLTPVKSLPFSTTPSF